MKTTIGVLGATGRVGGTAARTLISKGIYPRLIVRNAHQLPENIRTAAEVIEADLTRPETAIAATTGLETLFWLTPDNFQAEDIQSYYEAMGDCAKQIVQKNNIARVVQLSAAGADQDQFGIISAQRIIEDAFQSVATHHFILRPAYFYENFLLQIQSLSQQGLLFELFPEDIVIPMVTTTDVGIEIARVLIDSSWSGTIAQEIRGPERHTMPSALTAFGQALSRSFTYVRVSSMEMTKVFQSLGATQSVIDNVLEMFKAIAEGRATQLEDSSVIVAKTGAQQFAQTTLSFALENYKQ
ncbi:MAG: NAD(P)H-binding protein [Cyanobacteria bacterium P01_A01_bin.123]